MPAFGNLAGGVREAIVDYILGEEKPASEYEGSNRRRIAARADDPPSVFAGFRRWLDDEGYPAIKPPWGTLNAVDLNTGEIKWKVVLGEYPELTARGLPPTGTENYGGPVVTALGRRLTDAMSAELDQRSRLVHLEEIHIRAVRQHVLVGGAAVARHRVATGGIDPAPAVTAT